MQLQIERLEAKLKRYYEELRDINTKSEMLIKLHKMQKECKEQKNFDQNNHIEKLSVQIKKLKDENDFNQRQKKSRYKERDKGLRSRNNTLEQNH